jgi:hypothetical protein
MIRDALLDVAKELPELPGGRPAVPPHLFCVKSCACLKFAALVWQDFVLFCENMLCIYAIS